MTEGLTTTGLMGTTAAPPMATTAVPPFAPGIYFDLPEDVYHADTALGSSGIRDVRRGAKYQGSEKESTIVGSAMHKLVLEGEKEFNRCYVLRPDDRPGATPSEKSVLTKAAKAKLLEHQELLHGDDWQMITGVSKLINSHPDLAGALDGAAREVSVFWERNYIGEPSNIIKRPIRMKCRWDVFKPRGIGDLKSIANERQVKLSHLCRRAIKSYRYDIQAEHYLEGRRALPALVRANRVYFCDSSGPRQANTPNDSLTSVQKQIATMRLDLCLRAASEPNFAFQFIFIPKQGVPNVWSCTLSPGNPILDFARTHIELALDMYLKVADNFDRNPMWSMIDPVEELSSEEMPGGEFGWE